ncbi:cell division cycle- protein [Serendipita sp. 405]|nr:cell division cycle- protein [Serendipita sp. 405]
MATLFNGLPRHGSVLDLFPPRASFQSAIVAQKAMSPTEYVDMDQSFGLPDASFEGDEQDRQYEDEADAVAGNHDVSLPSTASFNSPLSPPSFQQLESSPYGMDICSPSPSHPAYGKRIVVKHKGEESISKVFGEPTDFLLPPRADVQPPGTLLKKLKADKSFSPMSAGSIRSNGSNRSNGTAGKVSSIKSTASIKEADPQATSKLRGRARAALPSAWMPHSRLQSDVSQGSNISVSPVEESQQAEEAGDVSMEDAMEVDSPLVARRPPKADVKQRPLSLFIPTTSQSLASVIAQEGFAADGPAIASAMPGLSRNTDQYAQHFFDTPEPAPRTAVPVFDRNVLNMQSPSFLGDRIQESSPVQSPSADKYERCMSAGIPPSSSSSSLVSCTAASSQSSLNNGPLSANPLLRQGRKAQGCPTASRIPSLRNKALQRPGLEAMVGAEKDVQSDNAIPTRRLVPLSTRRAVSAFIQPGQFTLAPPSAVGAIPRPKATGSGLAKGRVVSMIVPSTAPLEGGNDSDDGDDGLFNSPSVRPSAVAGHRRMRSNGVCGLIARDIKSAFPGGSLRVRSNAQQLKSGGGSMNGRSRLANATEGPAPFLPFGDGEHSGKILPCHSVKDDGLMRITPATMQALLSGAYDAHVASYTIIDCRFKFEYEGGHIGGAINLNKEEDIERVLFEMAAKEGRLPVPSQSGMPGVRHPILVFHCEFSAKRGPTFAKHFRAKDRAKNAHVYPKLHYPELYILEGGYCSYYSAYPETCEPRGYVQMDAPQHSHARAADLDQFRRWNRTRSYTFGDNQSQSQSQSQPQVGLGITMSQSAENNSSSHSNAAQRNGTLPSVSTTKYPSQRRVETFHELHTLEEDHDASDEFGRLMIGQTGGSAPRDDRHEVPNERLLSERRYQDALAAALDDSPVLEDEPPRLVLSQEGDGEEDDEDNEDDGFGRLDSSPCVNAERKRGKSRGKQLLARTFKPLSFGLSLHPQGQSRGMTRAVSHAM